MTSLTHDVQSVGQSLFSDSSVQLHALGERAVTSDGRVFRYCKAGATALVPGKLQQGPAENTTNFQNLSVAVSSAGATTVTTTSTVTLTENQLAGGLLTVTAATTGAGYTYRIKSHPAATASVVTFTLEDPIITATTGTVTIDVHPNPYNGVIVNPSTATSAPVGVAVYPITATYYGWIQTHGPVSVLSDGGDAVGASVVASNGTDGAVEDVTGTAQAIVGTRLTGCATGEYGLVNLSID